MQGSGPDARGAVSRTCSACEFTKASDERYLGTALADRRHRALASESITDTLGYCREHGTLLARDAARTRDIARVLAEVLERWSTFLGNEAKYGERVEALSFRADRDCPGCRFGEHEAAVSNGATERMLAAGRGCEAVPGLCYPHFRELYVASPIHRESLLEEYVPHFRNDLRALMNEAPSAESVLERGWISPERVHAAVGRTAGEAPSSFSIWSGFDPAPCQDAPRLDADAAAWLESRDGCPVCLEKFRALEQWIADVQATVRIDQPLWMTFPTCSRHVWTAARRGGLEVAAAAAQYAAAISLMTLERRLWPFWRHEDSGVSLSVWRRRRRRARERGEPTLREAAGRPPRCRACERLAVAENRAIDAMLELLKQESGRAALEQGHGLCMKHFAMTHIFARSYNLRAFLASTQRDRLDRARRELDTLTDGGKRGGGSSAQQAEPLRAAIALFSEGPLA